MSKVALYWHTVKYLKPVQVFGRLRRLLPRRVRVAGERPALAPASGAWVQPAQPGASICARGTFRFLNEEKSLGWPMTWQPDKVPLLWLYNLHYFDDLNAKGSGERSTWHRDLIASWIEHNSPGAKPGWDSYPTSLRIVNWVKWANGGEQLSEPALASLAQQARWLSSRLEWHLLGNHLFANAKALVFAGTFFSGAEADDWLRTGAAILARELEEQVLPDGGNFELSPMYHAIFLADLLDLVNLGRRFPGRIEPQLSASLRAKAGKMLEWLAVMVHPDGQLAMFNDSAVGIAPTLGELAAYAARLGIAFHRRKRPERPTVTLLESSGYARLETRGAVVVCDVAPIGPDHLPGHGHADTLSFELSVGGERFVVNGGTSRYGTSEARVRERGTTAHSTVSVDEQDSSEVWSGFRVARRARPFGVEVEQSVEAVSLRASHDGYCRLHADIVHHRTWTLSGTALLVEDRVSGFWKRAVAKFLLHHEVEIAAVSPNAWSLRRRAAEVRLTVLQGKAHVVPSRHSLEFGRRLQTHAIALELEHGSASVELTWQ